MIQSRALFIFAIICIIAGLTAQPAYAAIITVDDGEVHIDDNGLCSLIEAIINANSNSQVHDDCASGTGDDVIELAAGSTYILSAGYNSTSTGLPAIADTATAGSLIINGNNATISGSGVTRIFYVSPGGQFQVNELTIRDGRADYGGGIFNDGGQVTVNRVLFTQNLAASTGPFTKSEGGAVFSDSGFVSLTDVSLIDNHVTTSGDGSLAGGGAVHNDTDSTMLMTNVTIAHNTASAQGDDSIAAGGGIIDDDRAGLTMVNVTLTGNVVSSSGARSQAYGGGLYTENLFLIGHTQYTVLKHVTMTGNTAASSGSNSQAYGGGIASQPVRTAPGPGKVHIDHTIIIGNTDALNGDCVVGPNWFSFGYNLLGGGCPLTGTGDFTYAGSLNDIFVTSTGGSPLLADNGGFTQTIALMNAGPAVNAGNPNFTPPPSFDQRGAGFNRVKGGRIDIGAFEVQSPNFAPVAVQDNYTTPFETPLVVNAPGVLVNDSDPDGNDLTAELVGSPVQGVLMFSTTGAFTYTSPAGFSGAITFTYRAHDGITYSNPVDVNITVQPKPNAAPVAVDDYYSTPFETPLNVPAPGVLGNDSDPDGDALVAITPSTPENGTLSLSSSGGFVYTPNNYFVGIDHFTYQASDGKGGIDLAAVWIEVIAPPNMRPIANDDVYYTDVSTTLTVHAPGVLGNDTDLENDPLLATLSSQPAHGSLTFHMTGGFTYTPLQNFSGTDTFTYFATDAEGISDAATVTIRVGDPDDIDIGLLPPPPPPGQQTTGGNLNAGTVLPTLLWTPPNGEDGLPVFADWYHIVIIDGQGNIVLDVWLPVYAVCNDTTCRFTLTLYDLPAGLINGDYQWYLQWWTDDGTPLGDLSDYVGPNDFAVEAPLSTGVLVAGGVTAAPHNPYVEIPLKGDDGAAWYHLWIGTPDYQHTAYYGWIQKPHTCNGALTCTLYPPTYPPSGTYIWYAQSWGAAGFNNNDPDFWTGPYDLDLNFAAPGRIGLITPTVIASDTVSLSWQADPAASWYHIWLGTQDFQHVYYNWHFAVDLGCGDGICSLLPDVILTPGETYIWYIEAWGPGGFSTSGDFAPPNDSWVQGQMFTP